MDKIITRCLQIFMKKEILLYLIFGGLTTLVDFLVYMAMMSTGYVSAAVATAAAWLAAVLFAYVTNRRYVFGCEGNLLSFVGTRLCSGLVQVLLMAALVDGLHLDKLVTKLAVGVLVTIMNYAGSRLLVFRKSEKEAHQRSDTDRRLGRTAARKGVTI